MPALVQPAVSSINVDDPSIAFKAARQLTISGVEKQPGDVITLGDLASDGSQARQIALQMCRTGYLHVVPATQTVQPVRKAAQQVKEAEPKEEKVLDLASMSMNQLRAKCKSLKLDTTGSKRDMQKRLENALG